MVSAFYCVDGKVVGKQIVFIGHAVRFCGFDLGDEFRLVLFFGVARQRKVVAAVRQNHNRRIVVPIGIAFRQRRIEGERVRAILDSARNGLRLVARIGHVHRRGKVGRRRIHGFYARRISRGVFCNRVF